MKVVHSRVKEERQKRKRKEATQKAQGSERREREQKGGRQTGLPKKRNCVLALKHYNAPGQPNAERDGGALSLLSTAKAFIKVKKQCGAMKPSHNHNVH